MTCIHSTLTCGHFYDDLPGVMVRKFSRSNKFPNYTGYSTGTKFAR